MKSIWAGLLGMIPLLLVTTACGPQAEDFSGTYLGTLERTETRGAQTFMQTRESYLVYIAPGERKEALIQFRNECAVRAQVDKDGTFEISNQACKETLDSSSLDATVNGSGTLSESGELTLNLTLEGTASLNTDSYDYTSTESFTGGLQ